MSSNTRCSGLSRQRAYSTSRMASALSRSMPIENVWDALGRQVAGRNYPPTNKNTLIRALTEKWDKLPQQLLDNVVQKAQHAFDVVKAAFSKAPVLKWPDFKRSFELLTDASSIGVGAVLNQEQRPVLFASFTLSSADRNYNVADRECLAVVWPLNKFRTYLGSRPIKVITDPAALTR
ncbi:retrovirus-related Pol polyprotein from transposon gypsy [Trichonephila clavipes]|nr:retrovirus-related Pol polyprotein from transposon gypsy [Trichonephila clavipes]